MAVLARIAIAVALVGCYDPGSPPAGRCEVSCSANHECPGDLTCLSDNFCHVPGEAVCSAADFVRREQFAGGTDHACAIDADRALSCWGTNADGELGVVQVDRSAKPVPVAIPSHEHWASVAAGATNTCAIDVDGELMCWGAANGPLPVTSGNVPAVVAKPSAGQWQSVALAANHGCAVFRPDDAPSEFGGDLYCWGDDTHGELGITGAPSGPYLAPTRVDLAAIASYRDWIDVGVGEAVTGNHTCARRQGGVVWCWGEGYAAGLPPSHDDAVTQPGEFYRLSVGDRWSCGATSAGEVYCWGVIDMAHAGAVAERVPDEMLPRTTSWTAVAVGRTHACALAQSGVVRCFGDGEFGQRGEYQQPPASSDGTDVALGGATATDLAAGDDFTCATTDSGWQCWGCNRSGQLGRGEFGDQPAFAQVRPDITWSAVATGTWVSCGIGRIGTDPSKLYCWGTSLNHLVISNSAAPVEIQTAGVPTSIAVADDHACYSTSTTSYCWGVDGNGQLGDGRTQTYSDTPVVVTDASDQPIAIGALTAGENSSCGVATGGSVMCWGTINGMSHPTLTNPILTLVNGDHLVEGRHAVCALTSNTLSCWGTYRSPGNMFPTGHPDPVAIALPMMFGPAPAAPLPTPSVAIGRDHICVHHNGYVMCWGANNAGQSGQVVGTDVLTPTAYPLFMPDIVLAASDDYTCDAATSGVVTNGPACWGALPIEPQGSDVGATTMSLASLHGCVLLGGGLYCWGRNDHNQVGVGIGFDPHPAPVVAQ